MFQQGTCKHFNGIQNDCCEADVPYKSVGKEGDAAGATGLKRSLPCMDKYNFHGATCDKREYPTDEECAAAVKELSERFDRVSAARNAIVKHAGPYKKGVSMSGETECPSCKGRLRYSRAGINGHIHAACETSGCVAWME